jgi:eukaryotic-like serine/threonine-protein kinase
MLQAGDEHGSQRDTDRDLLRWLLDYRQPAGAAETHGADDLEGKVVSHYCVLEKLNAGGMGVVYRARDLDLGREVALKFLSGEMVRSRTGRRRFRREAQTQAAVNHANVCAAYEFGSHDGRPFLAMELLSGAMLHRHIAGKPLAIRSILNWSLQVARGLGAVHNCGILHRDLKPANIFVSPEGHVKIVDFGLAKWMRSHESDFSAELESGAEPATALTRAGAPSGTPGYASPEQAQGRELDARTDLFSLGVVLYEMATGRRPFRGEGTEAITAAVLLGEFEPPSLVNPSVPRGLERIVAKALRVDREARYQHSAEILGDLARLKRRLDAKADAKAPAGRPAKRARKTTLKPL